MSDDKLLLKIHEWGCHCDILNNYDCGHSQIEAELLRRLSAAPQGAPEQTAKTKNPSANQIAKVIYERAFDCQWDELAEKADAEYFLWLSVGEAVQEKFLANPLLAGDEGLEQVAREETEEIAEALKQRTTFLRGKRMSIFERLTFKAFASERRNSDNYHGLYRMSELQDEINREGTLDAIKLNLSLRQLRDFLQNNYEILARHISGGKGQEPKLTLDNSEQVFFYEQEFYILSNFSAFCLYWKDARFDTSEAAYHFEKFPGQNHIQTEIHRAPSAHEAFKIAERHKSERRPDWDAVKVQIMEEILRAKVNQHEYVRRKLLETGGRELIENSWRDDYWGWGADRKGQNQLGKLWMKIRSELRAVALSGSAGKPRKERG
jgi:ribA/ribD-fused uncharacterized protein